MSRLAHQRMGRGNTIHLMQLFTIVFVLGFQLAAPIDADGYANLAADTMENVDKGKPSGLIKATLIGSGADDAKLLSKHGLCKAWVAAGLCRKREFVQKFCRKHCDIFGSKEDKHALHEAAVARAQVDVKKAELELKAAEKAVYKATADTAAAVKKVDEVKHTLQQVEAKANQPGTGASKKALAAAEEKVKAAQSQAVMASTASAEALDERKKAEQKVSDTKEKLAKLIADRLKAHAEIQAKKLKEEAEIVKQIRAARQKLEEEVRKASVAAKSKAVAKASADAEASAIAWEQKVTMAAAKTRAKLEAKAEKASKVMAREVKKAQARVARFKGVLSKAMTAAKVAADKIAREDEIAVKIHTKSRKEKEAQRAAMVNLEKVKHVAAQAKARADRADADAKAKKDAEASAAASREAKEKAAESKQKIDTTKRKSQVLASQLRLELEEAARQRTAAAKAAADKKVLAAAEARTKAKAKSAAKAAADAKATADARALKEAEAAKAAVKASKEQKIKWEAKLDKAKETAQKKADAAKAAADKKAREEELLKARADEIRRASETTLRWKTKLNETKLAIEAINSAKALSDAQEKAFSDAAAVKMGQETKKLDEMKLQYKKQMAESVRIDDKELSMKTEVVIREKYTKRAAAQEEAKRVAEEALIAKHAEAEKKRLDDKRKEVTEKYSAYEKQKSEAMRKHNGHRAAVKKAKADEFKALANQKRKIKFLEHRKKYALRGQARADDEAQKANAASLKKDKAKQAAMKLASSQGGSGHHVDRVLKLRAAKLFAKTTAIEAVAAKKRANTASTDAKRLQSYVKDQQLVVDQAKLASQKAHEAVLTAQKELKTYEEKKAAQGQEDVVRLAAEKKSVRDQMLKAADKKVKEYEKLYTEAVAASAVAKSEAKQANEKNKVLKAEAEEAKALSHEKVSKVAGKVKHAANGISNHMMSVLPG